MVSKRLRRTAARVAIGLLALGVAGGDLYLVAVRNDVTPVTLRDAVEAFRTRRPDRDGRPGGSARPRAQVPRPTAAAGPASPRQAAARALPFVPPAEGVYAYATEGYEEIDFAGGRHTYPDETYGTVRAGAGCRWGITYRLVEEHVDEIRWCGREGAHLLAGSTSTVEFFNQRDTVAYECEPLVDVLRAADAPGTIHRGTCRAEDGSTQRHIVTVRGVEQVRVGGVPVDALHVSVDVTLRGKADGRAHAEVWYHPATGLTLRLERTADTDGHSAIGTVRYHEELTLRLLALEPVS